MGFFESLFGGGADINEEMQRAESVGDHAVIDVRSADEYAAGHVPGAVNIPLDRIRTARTPYPNLSLPLFVYCLSGARSARACTELRILGYENVTDMGGINRWSGSIAKGGG